MTRLTAKIKEEIIFNGIEKAGFGTREKALLKREALWAEKVRIASVGGEKVAKKIEKAEADIKNIMAEFPVAIHSGCPFRYNTWMKIIAAGGIRYIYFTPLPDGCKDKQQLDHRISPLSHILKSDDPLLIELNEIEAEREAIKGDRQALTNQMKAVLSSVNTVKQLLEAWPESKELIPNNMGKAQNKLPAVRFSDLNSIIGLPSDVAKAS